MKLYFAHPVTDYDTPFEASCRGVLREFAPGFLCPNAPEHDAAYKAEGWPYFDRLVETCNAVCFVRVPDGRVSAGVAKEVESFFRRGLPVFEIGRNTWCIHRAHAMPGPVMTIDETRAFIRRTRAVRAALATFQAERGYHKAATEELLEDFGAALFDRLAAEAETKATDLAAHEIAKAVVLAAEAPAAVSAALDRYGCLPIPRDVEPREGDPWAVVNSTAIGRPGDIVSEHVSYADARIALVRTALEEAGIIPKVTA